MLIPVHAVGAVYGPIHRKAHILQKRGGDLRVQVIVLRQQQPLPGEAAIRLLLRPGGLLLTVRLIRQLMGQRHGEFRPLPLLAFHGDRAAHQLHKAPDDGHTQSGSQHFARSGVPFSGKGLIQVRQELFADTDAGIGHLGTQRHIPRPGAGQLLGGDRDGPTGWSVLDGVADQVCKELLQLCNVA